MKEEFFTYRFPYMSYEVLAAPTWWWHLEGLNKLVFLKENLFFFWNVEIGCVYGTIGRSFGEEFLGVSPWTIETDRAVYRRLVEMDLIKSVAVLYPVAEVDH